MDVQSKSQASESWKRNNKLRGIVAYTTNKQPQKTKPICCGKNNRKAEVAYVIKRKEKDEM